MKIILGVTGGVAAYKAAELARRLMDLNLSVQVVMTANAEKFVTPLTFEALTGNRVLRAGMPEPGQEPMPHITLPKQADLFVVAPATANILGKYANGIADDTLSTMLIASGLPVIVAPAMNTNMYNNPAVQENIKRLKERNVKFVGPSGGTLACGDEGEGKLAPVEDIVDAVVKALSLRRDFDHLNVIVTAGGTREPIDAVRFIGNRSSGKMGSALALAAKRRGADVTLITGSMEVPAPEGVKVIEAPTAKEMLLQVGSHFGSADILIMTAAVGDYRVMDVVEGKGKKKESYKLSLKPNPDILAEMGRRKKGQTIVGFAAETDNPEENGRAKLMEKKMDMVVINDVSNAKTGFGSDYNEILIVTRSGKAVKPPKALKSELAEIILDIAIQIHSRNKNSVANTAG